MEHVKQLPDACLGTFDLLAGAAQQPYRVCKTQKAVQHEACPVVIVSHITKPQVSKFVSINHQIAIVLTQPEFEL
jgi:hypothetical protein